MWIFPSLACITLATDSVHGNRQRFVRLFADRSIGHRASLESFDDTLLRLNFINRDWCTIRLQVHGAAQCAKIARLVVYQFAVLFENFVILCSAGMLQLVNRLWVEEVKLPIASVLVLAAGFECLAGLNSPAKCRLVPLSGFLCNNVQANSA